MLGYRLRYIISKESDWLEGSGTSPGLGYREPLALGLSGSIGGYELHHSREVVLRLHFYACISVGFILFYFICVN